MSKLTLLPKGKPNAIIWFRVFELMGQPQQSQAPYQHNFQTYPAANQHVNQVQTPGVTYFSNLNVSQAQAMPQMSPLNKGVVGTTLEDYIARAFKKCITAPERIEMSKLLSKVTNANKNK